jgi:hypothetical protein
MSLHSVRWLAASVLFTSAAFAAPQPEVTYIKAVKSLPLSILAADALDLGGTQEVENFKLPLGLMKHAEAEDSVVQTRLPANRVGTTDLMNFKGIGDSDFGYSVQYAPPDTTGAIGTTQYVQWVNVAFAVFNKSNGHKVLGPLLGKTLFSALGGPCASTNDGDPLVLFDHLSNRWVLSQFSVHNPYFQCVAVSQTDDATGAYNLYALPFPQFNDYGKIGVWPDAYYMSYNMFNPSFQGARLCAMDRLALVAGLTATQVCYQLSNSHGGLLPADMDGTKLPDAGAPGWFLEIANSLTKMNIYRLHADFLTPANSTLTGPTTTKIAAFTLACGNGGTCVPQPGTTQKLDTLGDRLMYRLAYRRIGKAEHLVVNHAVKSGTGVAPRWYEFKVNKLGNLKAVQQSTFAPDADSRWMGSVAMDKQGNMAMGYSVSSTGTFPSIRYTGRLVTDPLSTMQAENSLTAGTGSQTTGLSRWGDYSTLTLDPADDCTFWYTTEYLQLNGTWNWHTRIASFKFPGCT